MNKVGIGVGLVLLATSITTRAEDKVTFEDHIKPIFREHCLSCHNANEKKSDLALDTYAATMAGGSGGEIVSAGDIDSSRLWELVAHVAQPFMPPQQDKLSDAKLALIKQWIEQGMPENSGSAIKKKSAAAASMLSSAGTGKPDGPPPMPERMLKQPAIYTPRSAAISAMGASPWAPLIAVGGQLQVSLYHSESGELLGIVPFPEGEPQSITFTRDGKQLLIGGGRHGSSGCAVLVDVASGERIAKVGDELDTVLSADISPDKTRIALAGPQKLVRIYDTESGELVREMKKHTDWIYAIRFSPDGVLLSSADRSNGLIVWEADSGRLYADLPGHKGEIRSIDFRSDSNVLATASLDGTVKLWDMQESKLQKSVDAHAGGAMSVAFAQDGSFASSGRDQKVRLWNADGSKKAEFDGLSEAVLEVAIVGSGMQLAAGDWNGNVKLWQTSDAKSAKTIAANPPTLIAALEEARSRAAQLKKAWEADSKASLDSQGALATVQSKLAGSANSLKEISEKLAADNAKKQKLTDEVASQSKLIAELEAKLSAAKKSKELSTAALAETTTRVAEQTKLAETIKSQHNEFQSKHDDLQKLAQAASAKLMETEMLHKAAVDSVSRVEADIAAYERRSQELKQESEKVVSLAAQVEKEIAEKTRLQAAKDAELKKLTEEMQKLQAELASIQQKVNAAANAQATAQSELTATQAAATELKNSLEKAQQEAIQAAERLKLFQESYKK